MLRYGGVEQPGFYTAFKNRFEKCRRFTIGKATDGALFTNFESNELKC